MSRTTPRPVVFLFFLAGLLINCSGPADQLDTQISEALTTDNAVDATEASQIKAFVKKEKNHLLKDDKAAKLYTTNGLIDDAALLAYIKRSKTYKELAKDGAAPTVSLVGTETVAKPLQLKLYLEASGSMFPYDAPGGNGAFKRTLNDL
ncbi:MAG: hypothetical protein H7319_15660, partial [Spirosoma sp.]|nr:hypothetical protein [Spirosoma sp.]